MIKSAENLIKMPVNELIASADKVRDGFTRRIDLCGILNAKSGHCSENCKFCAQSAHHKTPVKTYELIDKNEMLDAARKAITNGARRFGIVTSGNRLKRDELKIIAEVVNELARGGEILPCASLGELSYDELMMLKDAGLTRYHHNIETSERYYPYVVTTHTFSDRIKTIRVAKKVGLAVCSGGIFGIGETWEDRVSMAEQLKDLGVDSVPINFLIPIPGTPFESMKKVSLEDAVRIIAIFRTILGDKTIRVCAGRETVFSGCEAAAFMAGADGMMIGGYLTVKGRSVEDDRVLVEEIERRWNKK